MGLVEITGDFYREKLLIDYVGIPNITYQLNPDLRTVQLLFSKMEKFPYIDIFYNDVSNRNKDMTGLFELLRSHKLYENPNKGDLTLVDREDGIEFPKIRISGKFLATIK